MVLSIAKQDLARHSELLEKVYRFRHRFFVDHLGREALRRADGREIDRSIRTPGFTSSVSRAGRSCPIRGLQTHPLLLSRIIERGWKVRPLPFGSNTTASRSFQSTPARPRKRS